MALPIVAPNASQESVAYFSQQESLDASATKSRPEVGKKLEMAELLGPEKSSLLDRLSRAATARLSTAKARTADVEMTSAWCPKDSPDGIQQDVQPATIQETILTPKEPPKKPPRSRKSQNRSRVVQPVISLPHNAINEQHDDFWIPHSSMSDQGPIKTSNVANQTAQANTAQSNGQTATKTSQKRTTHRAKAMQTPESKNFEQLENRSKSTRAAARSANMKIMGQSTPMDNVDSIMRPHEMAQKVRPNGNCKHVATEKPSIKANTQAHRQMKTKSQHERASCKSPARNTAQPNGETNNAEENTSEEIIARQKPSDQGAGSYHDLSTPAKRNLHQNFAEDPFPGSTKVVRCYDRGQKNRKSTRLDADSSSRDPAFEKHVSTEKFPGVAGMPNRDPVTKLSKVSQPIDVDQGSKQSTKIYSNDNWAEHHSRSPRNLAIPNAETRRLRKEPMIQFDETGPRNQGRLPHKLTEQYEQVEQERAHQRARCEMVQANLVDCSDSENSLQSRCHQIQVRREPNDRKVMDHPLHSAPEKISRSTVKSQNRKPIRATVQPEARRPHSPIDSNPPQRSPVKIPNAAGLRKLYQKRRASQFRDENIFDEEALMSSPCRAVTHTAKHNGMESQNHSSMPSSLSNMQHSDSITNTCGDSDGTENIVPQESETSRSTCQYTAPQRSRLMDSDFPRLVPEGSAVRGSRYALIDSDLALIGTPRPRKRIKSNNPRHPRAFSDDNPATFASEVMVPCSKNGGSDLRSLLAKVKQYTGQIRDKEQDFVRTVIHFRKERLGLVDDFVEDFEKALRIEQEREHREREALIQEYQHSLAQAVQRSKTNTRSKLKRMEAEYVQRQTRLIAVANESLAGFQCVFE